MAGRYGGSSVKLFLVDGYSLLAAKVKELRDKTLVGLERSDGLGDEWDETTPTGHAKAELAQQGAFYDDDTANLHEAMSGKQQTSRIVCYGYEGNAIGARVILQVGAFAVAYERLAALEGLVKANVDYQSSGAKSEGVILHALGEETGDADTEASSVDAGASTENGGTAFVQVTTPLTLGGYTDAVVTILDSEDDAVFVLLVALPAITAAPAASVLAVSGHVGQYLAQSVAFTGAGSGPSITYMAGFARG
jgi:hypothetical protein